MAEARRPQSARTDHFRLRILQFEKGERHTLRITGVPTIEHRGELRIAGCLTYYKGQVFYFDPANPAPGVRQRDLTWKGYLQAEVYSQPQNLWFPCIWEITEHVEVDLRGEPLRGQVWECYRPVPVSKAKKPAMVATWLEDRDPNTFPPPPDMMPTLVRRFHVAHLVLDKVNPMPGPTIVRPSAAAPPPNVQAARQDAQTVESEEKPVIVRRDVEAELAAQIGKPPAAPKDDVHAKKAKEVHMRFLERMRNASPANGAEKNGVVD